MNKSFSCISVKKKDKEDFLKICEVYNFKSYFVFSKMLKLFKKYLEKKNKRW